jgi:hypothetical protein
MPLEVVATWLNRPTCWHSVPTVDVQEPAGFQELTQVIA